MEKTHPGKKSAGGLKKRSKLWLLLLLLIPAALAAVYFILYNNVYPCLVLELGQPLPQASVFLKDGGEAEYISPPVLEEGREGTYFPVIDGPGGRRLVILAVRDSQPPQAEDAQTKLLPGERVSPEDAVKNLKDGSAVSFRWETEPDFSLAGLNTYTVLMEDAYGNEGSVQVSIEIAGIAESVEHVIGQEPPGPEAFVSNWQGDVEYAGDMSGTDWNTVSVVPVELLVGGLPFSSQIDIVDKTPPELELIPRAIEKGGSLEAEDFVYICRDSSSVSYRFEAEPDSSVCGSLSCGLVAEDSSGNSQSFQAQLLVCDKVIELEAGGSALSAGDLISMLGEDYAWYSAQELAEFVPERPGASSFQISDGENSLVIGLQVNDSIPPTATALEPVCYLGYEYSPEHFVTDVSDALPVELSFVSAPDWSQAGDRTVEICLRDEAGNSSSISVSTVFMADTEAPVIFGAKDRYCYVGESVAYMKGVFARDNADEDCEITVDKSAVDYRTAGEYPVTYTVTDKDGNSSSQSVYFTFIEQAVSDEELEQLAQNVLAEILTEDMSLAEQARAIYDYVFLNIRYNGHSDKTDWKSEAYRGLTEFKGDCFTFYAAANLLLSQIDCEVLPVERIGGVTRHYWCLVNLGSGWYHFDACNAGPNGMSFFMKTTQELYAIDYAYFHFEEADFPETAAEPFSGA